MLSGVPGSFVKIRQQSSPWHAFLKKKNRQPIEFHRRSNLATSHFWAREQRQRLKHRIPRSIQVPSLKGQIHMFGCFYCFCSFGWCHHIIPYLIVHKVYGLKPQQYQNRTLGYVSGSPNLYVYIYIYIHLYKTIICTIGLAYVGSKYVFLKTNTPHNHNVAISDQAPSSTQRSKSFCGHCLDIVSTSMTFARAVQQLLAAVLPAITSGFWLRKAY